MRKILCFVLLCVLVVPAYAEEKAVEPLAEAPEKAESMPKEDAGDEGINAEEKDICNRMKAEIYEDMAATRECWQDHECVGVRFGCPWEAAGCNYTIIGMENKEKVATLVAKMSQYDVMCLNRMPGMSRQCEVENASNAKGNCGVPRLKCINGKCVTRTYAIIQNDLE